MVNTVKFILGGSLFLVLLFLIVYFIDRFGLKDEITTVYRWMRFILDTLKLIFNVN